MLTESVDLKCLMEVKTNILINIKHSKTCLNVAIIFFGIPGMLYNYSKVFNMYGLQILLPNNKIKHFQNILILVYFEIYVKIIRWEIFYSNKFFKISIIHYQLM